MALCVRVRALNPVSWPNSIPWDYTRGADTVTKKTHKFGSVIETENKNVSFTSLTRNMFGSVCSTTTEMC